MHTQLLDGRYRIVANLSRGGFGETYVAEDIRRPGHPKCVVKHLKPVVNHSQNHLVDAKRLFSSEAEALEKLGGHNQIPQLLACFEDHEELYLVQEFIEGQPLSVELQRGDRWTEEQVTELLQDILHILEFIHAHDIIHRDIKPDNIIRRQSDQRLILIDFGAVKVMQQPMMDTDANLANTTIAIASNGYTPVEQLHKKPRPGSDIYALGMVAIQALTGRHPEEFEEALHIDETHWLCQMQVSAHLAAILGTMVSYHWKTRYRTATEVLQALQELTSHSVDATVDANATPMAIAVAAEAIAPAKAVESPHPLPRYQPTAIGTAKSSDIWDSSLFDPVFPNVPSHVSTSQSQSSSAQISKPTDSKGKTASSQKTRYAGIGLIALGTTLFTAFNILFGLMPRLQNTHSLAPVPDHLKAKTMSQDMEEFWSNQLLIETLSEASAPIQSLAFSADGNTLISNGTDNTIKSWNLQTAGLQTSFTHVLEISSVAVNPDGQTFATASVDNTIKVWSLQTGQLLDLLEGHQWGVSAITISPNGKILVSSDSDPTIKIWDLETAKPLHTLTLGSQVSALDISLDGSLLVAGSDDYTIKMWDLQTRQNLRPLKGHSDKVTSIAVSSNSAVLVSGSGDRTVKVWNIHSRQLLHTLSGHSEAVNAVAISPSDRLIASGSDDGTIKLWDLYTGELLHTLTGHSKAVQAIAFSPNGGMLASGSRDGAIKLWRVP